MLINTLSLKLLNKLLESNESGRSLLSKYAHRSFCLIVPGFNIKALIDESGFLSHTIDDSQYDVSIHIPISSATYLVNNDKLELYKKIEFHGDSNLGRELLEIIANLHFSGLYNLSSSPFKLIIVNKLHHIFETIKQQIKLMRTNTSTSVREYLLYESEDLVTHFEHDSFCNEVDSLRERTVKLEHQIAGLTPNLQKNS